MSYAKLCNRMQGNEIVNAILVLIRKKPQITNKEISFTLKLHRNTVSKYRKFIRHTYVKTPQEIVNKIDSRLEEDLDGMLHSTLLTYRGQLVPRTAEIKTEIKETIKQEVTVNLNEIPEDERKLIEHAVRVYVKGRGKAKPTSFH